MSESLGTVSGLWRYPVKSMQGEAIDAAAADQRGRAGDRGWAVADAQTQKIASAKHPKLWLAMLECRAAYVGEPAAGAPVRITLPDGREVRSDDRDRDARLSEALGRPVTLLSSVPEDATYELVEADAQGLDAADPDALTETGVGLVSPGTFFDTCSLHVVTSDTLSKLRDAHPDGDWDVRRFRPNLLVELDAPADDGFAEGAWIGHSLHVGEETRAAVLAEMPRCVMTTLPQPGLGRDPLILRTIAERNRKEIPGYGAYACAGALANFTAPGTVRVGDRVALGAAL